jgi:hypothetical protein
MKKGTRTLIGIVRNYDEEAIFLYFKDGTYSRVDCNVDITTDEEAIQHYQKYGDILERNYKVKNTISRLKKSDK